ncbi:MAG: DUF4239 domain-containing protein [Candidatus Eremiobacteraeota bacterium]|nr:DUF4239 domain-containing protein [Candidatus Eremiobacteraeota bacterium]
MGLYAVSPILLLVIAICVGAGLACAGQIAVHRHFSSQDFVRHNEVGGFIIAVVGTLYAVVLGFLTVIVWQHFVDARDLVAQETAATTDTWHVSVGLPTPERRRVRQDVQRYAELMVDTEWPIMRSGNFDKEADALLMDAITAAGMFVPADARENNAQSQTLSQLTAIHDARLRRLSINLTGVSSFEWLVLLIGAICVVCFCWLFGLANPTVHLLMTSSVTIVVVAILVLLFELQYPFRSQIGVSDHMWRGFVSHIQLMQNSNLKDMHM